MRYSGALLLWLPPWSAGAFIRSLFVVRRERLNAGLAGRLDELPDDIAKLVKGVTLDLWDGHDIPVTKSDDPSVRGNAPLEGEAGLPFDVAFDERAEFFRAKALDGDPRAQHSYALLRWSGFGGVARDELESAKFHAAAASQNHLDGLAALGGCLRTGTGVKRDVGLGLRIIDLCSGLGNPTGVNKKAALLESNDDDFGAVRLYQEAVERGRVNALLLFNLGWAYIHGSGVEADRERGLNLWRESAGREPDEGSEEAAWNLHLELEGEDRDEANKWLIVAQDLGYEC
mmetsp:Transcript_12330/g.28093  ORF Transcript_12330/g.28093 Transcript_12330/m.28093 type:complete len:287 (-) Transcript_12330:21-881(-)